MPRPRVIAPATDAYRGLVARYERYRRAHGYGAHGARTAAYRVGEFLAWLEGRGVLEIAAVTGAEVAAYWGYLGVRPGHNAGGGTLGAPSQAGHRVAVRGALAMLHHAGELASDPASAAGGEPGGRAAAAAAAAAVEVPALTQAEVRALYAATASQLERACLGLGYGCGLRVSEAVALDVGSVKLYGGGRPSGGSVAVERGKGGRRRVVPLSAGVRDDLADYYHGERVGLVGLSAVGHEPAALVLNVRGARMRAWTYNKVLAGLVGRAIAEGRLGADVLHKRTSFHGLRHAVATHLLERGLTLEQVRLFLGHRNVETTEVYTHVSRALLDELVER